MADGTREDEQRSPLWDNALSRLLGCRYPVMLAGMGGVARYPLAVAVAQAGGFPCLGMVRESPDFIAAQIRGLRASWSGGFAVNLIPAATDPGLLAEQVATCLELKVPAMVLFWDVDADLVARLLRAGVRVIWQVGNTFDAREAIDAGAEALIVQGCEAGGHVRGKEPVLKLIQRIAAFSPVPLAAAGGIASGEDISRMFKAGAQGVSCGTAFLATHESSAHDYHKQRVVAARATDTVLTTVFWRNWHRPAPVRVIRNALTEQEDAGDADTPVIIAQQDGLPVYRNSTDSPLTGAEGDLELMALYAGESCERIQDIVSAGERLRRLLREAEHCHSHHV